MHETALIGNLLRIVLKTVKEHNISRVESVTLSVGKLSNAMPGALAFAFEAAVRGGPPAGDPLRPLANDPSVEGPSADGPSANGPLANGPLANGPLANAKLIIKEIPVTAKCEACGSEYDPPGFPFVCPKCQNRYYSITRGEEIYIESIKCIT